MTNFWTPLSLYDLLRHQKSISMGPESLNSLHKLMLPENVFTSDFCGIKMYEKWPIFIILVNFDQFSDLLRTLWTLHDIKKVHERAQKLSIASINLYYQKMY